jgi:hypothetical protein
VAAVATFWLFLLGVWPLPTQAAGSRDIAPISIDGPAVALTTTVPAQVARLSFTTTTANQVLSLQVSGNTYRDLCGRHSVQIIGPSPASTLVGATTFCTGAKAITLPTAGTYTLLELPASADTGSLTIKLVNAPTVAAPISIDGAAVALTTTVPAQTARLSFTTKTASQVLSLRVSGDTYRDSCGTHSVQIIGPSPATTVVNSTTFCTGAKAITLPTAGTYTLLESPAFAANGSLTVKLVNAPTIIAPISIDGAAATVTTTVPAQTAQLSFTTRAANQILRLQVSGDTYPDSCGSHSAQVIGPSPATTFVTSMTFCTGVKTITLRTAGTYTLLESPAFAANGSLTIKLVDVPTVIAPISVAGAAVTLATTVPAQIAQLNFTTKAANQTLRLQVSGDTYPDSCDSHTVEVLGPSPTTTFVSSTSFCTGAKAITLPTAGTYMLLELPAFADNGSLTVKLQ